MKSYNLYQFVLSLFVFFFKLINVLVTSQRFQTEKAKTAKRPPAIHKAFFQFICLQHYCCRKPSQTVVAKTLKKEQFSLA
jgi:hypothetical protein